MFLVGNGGFFGTPDIFLIPRNQKFALLDYCSKQGLQNYEMFVDQGISGAKESRPALNEMMARVEKQECSQVIVFSFSRFPRRVSHLLKALQKFKEKNIRFVSTTEQLDTNSPMGLALFTILGALAQMEREIIRNRVIAGLQNAKAKGKRIGRERNDRRVFSFAVGVKDHKTGEIVTGSTEDRQWAVAREGQCVEAEFFPYPPWDFPKWGTYYNVRLLKLRECAEEGPRL